MIMDMIRREDMHAGQLSLKFDEIAEMLKIFSVIFDISRDTYAAQLFIKIVGRGRGGVCYTARNWEEDSPPAGPAPAEAG